MYVNLCAVAIFTLVLALVLYFSWSCLSSLREMQIKRGGKMKKKKLIERRWSTNNYLLLPSSRMRHQPALKISSWDKGRQFSGCFLLSSFIHPSFWVPIQIASQTGREPDSHLLESNFGTGNISSSFIDWWKGGRLGYSHSYLFTIW